MTVYRKGVRTRLPKSPEALHGINEIALYMGISYNTARRWIVFHGLPATKTPTGKWFTTKRAINAWIFAGHEAYLAGEITDNSLKRGSGAA